jgi:hypothetical protein
VWYHVVRIRTFDVIQFQATHSTTYGIWAHVYFPSGRHFDYYENTQRNGFWQKRFGIPSNALSKYSSTAVITLRLWHGKSHRDAHRTFTVIR